MIRSKLFFALCLAGVMVFTDFRLEGEGPLPLSIGFATPAAAVIGRPLTPLSYAGVARRTTRRVVRRTATTIAVLPPGCIYGLIMAAIIIAAAASTMPRAAASMFR